MGRRTRVYHPEVSTLTGGEEVDELVAEIMDRGARYRSLCQLRTFTYATGETARVWLHPWTSEPSEARVLTTPPPWSVS
jgi:hypothetical protein